MKRVRKRKRPRLIKITKARQLKMARSAKRKALAEWGRTVRAAGRCAVCGSKKFLNAHHILSKERYGHLMFCIENGVVLCSNCHKYGVRSFHGNGVWATLWLQKYRPAQFAWAVKQLGCLDVVRRKPKLQT